MITLQDVADNAGFTKTTVSHVLNGHEKERRISEKTAVKIREIAKNMGYQVDGFARAMILGKANAIGFVTNCEDMDFSGPVMASIMKNLAQHEYFVKVINYDENVTVESLFETCLKQRLSGLVCYSLNSSFLDKLSELLQNKDIALAIVGSGDLPENCTRVASNDFQGGQIAAEHLIRLGHTKISFIANQPKGAFTIERKHGFTDTMEKHGLTVSDESNIIAESKEEVKMLLSAIMKGKNRPTAFFCVSDALAITTIMTLIGNGFKVPEDVSVVGYANINTGYFAVPALTTIDEQYSLIGEKVANQMMNKINNSGNNVSNNEVTDVKLVVRESSGPVPISEKTEND